MELNNKITSLLKGDLDSFKTFKDYYYERPNYQESLKDTEEIIKVLMTVEDFEEVCLKLDEFNKKRNLINTMFSLAEVRNTIDTNDSFYEEEKNFIDENAPLFAEIDQRFLKVLLDSKHQPKLEEKYGKRLFESIRLSLETFSPEIIEDLQEEGKLCSKYDRLLASAKISFDGKILNLSQMSAYMHNSDRNIRRDAEKAISGFLQEKEDELDDIYDNLVKVRTKIAKKLGFNDFIELAYKRLGRTEYNKDDVKKYRDEILSEIVPLVEKIYEKQTELINIPKEEFKSYDMNYKFATGNPKPIGDTKQKIDNALKMYHELSDETAKFSEFMFGKELIDLEAKPGKVGGGYCTYFPSYKSPFVFSNFNGSSGDVDVLTHEFGHAFQVYSSRNYDFMEYYFPTMESAEIHSMSMEFFAWPWMDDFFGDDVLKYKYQHLSSSITFIPYGALVDAYQHEVYANPELTKEERKQVWRKLEKEYMPFKVYENEFLNKGTWWYRQGHIFSSPFYYIDYTLAQNCAHQFWIKNNENHEKAWEDYLKICKAGGTKSFLELVGIANLRNPFITGTVKEVTSKLSKWLDDFDISKLK